MAKQRRFNFGETDTSNQVSVWDKLREKRLKELEDIKESAKEVGITVPDTDQLTLQEINDLLREIRQKQRDLKREIIRQERVATMNELKNNSATTGSAAHDRYKEIMDMLVKGSKENVRSMDSQDVFNAFDEISDNYDGKLLTYQQFMDATAPKDELDWDLDLDL